MYYIIIIGGGPNGIYCFNTMKKKFPDKNLGLIEKSSISNNIKKYPNVIWHNKFDALSFDSENKNNTKHPTTKEVINYYEDYFIKNNLKFIKNEVIDIIKYEGIYKIILKDNEILSKFIIISTGIYENKNTLNINTNYPYIKYSYIDLKITNKNLVLIGGGNSSIDYIIYLLPNNKITWILRNTYTRNSAHLDKFNNIIQKYRSNLCIYENTNVKEFYKNNSLLLSNNTLIKDIDNCNILIGYNNISDLIKKIGIQHDNKFINIDENYQTSLKNIFIFGSLASQNNDMVYINKGNPDRLKKIINYIQNN